MKTKSRKQARKELRRAKKIKKHEFFSKKKSRNKFEGEVVHIKNETKHKKTFKKKKAAGQENKRVFKNPLEVMDFERQKEKKQKEKFEKEIHEQRIKQLKADNLKEDQEIRKLEKQLKMKTGKSKLFAYDGLDYLLDVCDKTHSKNVLDKLMENSDSEFESDLENIVGKGVKPGKLNKKQKKESTLNKKEEKDLVDEESTETEEDVADEESIEVEEDVADEESIDVEEDVADEESIEADEDETIDEAVTDSESEEFAKNRKLETSSESGKQITQEEKSKVEVWEDIYGRTRDDKGNVIATYTPPHLRQKTHETDSEKQLRLKKQLKGLLNRLAESNMAFISNQIEHLYMSNSRNDMNETLCTLFMESLFGEVSTPEKLIMEHALLIAVLHANVGSEIGAHFLQFAITEFSKLLNSEPDVEDKKINNVLTFIMHLYNFQVFNVKLMYDILNELLKKLEEKEIELLLMTLRTVGFSLRKDDPFALKSFIFKVQERANEVQPDDNGSRVKFMLDMLMAIKNNNMSKIPNYNPEIAERLRKNLKLLIRKGNYSSELNISLQDLLNAEKHGRWWIVGSAWSGKAPAQTTTDEGTREVQSTEFSQKLLKLAKKQRMNTDVRRNIFCILMSAEDFLEAFERLVKLKLKGAVEREIMNVLLHCAMQEKSFNPYYMYLANKFCAFDRKYQMMLQCAVWDRIKELKNAKPIEVTNLAKFVGNVVLEKGLPISILKVIEFSDLDKPTMKFMRQVLLAVLVSDDRHAIAAVFKRIADSPKLKMFRESLRLFLRQFVLKNAAKNVEQDKATRLADAIRLAEQTLDSSDGSIVF